MVMLKIVRSLRMMPFFLIGPMAIAQPGALDTAFHGNGISIQNYGSGESAVRCMTLQPDGKIVAVSSAFDVDNWRSYVLRFTPAGNLDTGFGEQGIVTSTLDTITFTGVALQSDGRIVVAGTQGQNMQMGAAQILMRFMPDGAVDSTFGMNGVVIRNLFPKPCSTTCLVIQPDGKIITGGRARFGSYYYHEGLITRYNTDGGLDSTFGSNGCVEVYPGGSGGVVDAITLQPDGKIVAAGSHFGTWGRFLVLRLLGNGALDPSFGTGGIREEGQTDQDAFANSVIVMGDGDILVGGQFGFPLSRFALVRFDPNGSLDQTWGGSGKVTTAFSGYSSWIRRLGEDPDGKIIAVGNLLDYQPTDVGVAISRYLPTGVLDTQFGTYGKVAMSINQQERTAVYSMNIQDDGKVLVCGMAGTSATGPREALVMRFMRGSYTGIPDIEQDLSEASWYRNADGSLSVSYSLDRPGSVQLDLYDTQGRSIFTVEDPQHAAGHRHVVLDKVPKSIGLYVLTLTTRSGERHTLLLE